MGTVLVLLFFLAVCGLIAYLGDLIGRRFGKKRLSLFGMRPRYTAVVITIITGVLIAAGSLGFAFGVSPAVRVAVLEGERLARLIPELRRQVNRESGRLRQAEARNRQLRAELEALAATRRTLEISNRQLAAQNERLQTQNRSLQLANRGLKQRNRSLLAANQQLGREKQRLVSRNTAQRQHFQQLNTQFISLTRQHQHLSQRHDQMGSELEQKRRELEHARTELQQAMGNLERTRQNLEQAQSELARLQTQAMDLASQVRGLEATNQGLRAENSQLTRQNETLKAAADEATRQLQDQEQLVQDAQNRVRRARENLAVLEEEVRRLEGRIRPYEARELILTSGQEVARRPLPAGAPPEIVRSALRNLLFEAQVNAERRGARPDRPGGPVVFLDEVEVRDVETGVARVLSSEAEVLASLEIAALRDGGALLFRAVAARNVPAGTPVPLYIMATPMRLAARRGTEVAATVVDPEASRRELWAELLRFLQVDVRREAVERLGIEPGGQWELAHVDWANLSDVIQRIKSFRRPARVIARARYDTWTSGPLELELTAEEQPPTRRAGRARAR